MKRTHHRERRRPSPPQLVRLFGRPFSLFLPPTLHTAPSKMATARPENEGDGGGGREQSTRTLRWERAYVRSGGQCCRDETGARFSTPVQLPCAPVLPEGTSRGTLRPVAERDATSATRSGEAKNTAYRVCRYTYWSLTVSRASGRCCFGRWRSRRRDGARGKRSWRRGRGDCCG